MHTVGIVVSWNVEPLKSKLAIVETVARVTKTMVSYLVIDWFLQLPISGDQQNFCCIAPLFN